MVCCGQLVTEGFQNDRFSLLTTDMHYRLFSDVRCQSEIQREFSIKFQVELKLSEIQPGDVTDSVKRQWNSVPNKRSKSEFRFFVVSRDN